MIMNGEIAAYDETLTTVGGMTYGFRLARGTHGFSTTTNPFAAKSTQGDRSYSDYDALQAVAFSEFSGGYGQERMESPTRYWNGVGVDTRGGKIVLGPLPHYDGDVRNLSCGSTLDALDVDQTGNVSWFGVYAPTRQKVAAWFDCPGDVNDIARVWLPLAVTVSAGTVEVGIYQNTPSSDGIGEPAATPMASITMARQSLRPTGSWVEAVFPFAVSVAPGSRYWIIVRTDGTDAEAIGWMTVPQSVFAPINAKVYDGTAWTSVNEHLVLWYDDSAVHPDSALRLLMGVGEDGVMRLWGWCGRRLYYVDAGGAIQVVQNGMGAPYEAPAEITDACWFRGTGDAHPYLYIALGDDADMVKFDGNIGAEQWATIGGLKARALAVHDNKLWIANSVNMVGFSTSGSTVDGTAVACGDKTYGVSRMLSWSGALYIGKADGLYRATYTGTSITIQSVADFRAQADSNNFAFLIDHRGDLIFPIAQGIVRYTAGGIMSSFAAEAGADILLKDRSYYRGACSSLGALWCVVEGPPGHYSAVLAYVDGGWHPLIIARRFGDFMRSIVIDPGVYGNLPRLWYGSGMQLAYVDMPTTTQKRYLATDPGYVALGMWESSWFDGNLRTIDKDWMRLELDGERMAAGGPRVDVYYRFSREEAWQPLGTAQQSGIVSFSFPSGTYSARIQLQLRLWSGLYNGVTETPRVNAIVLKYLDRPEAVHTYLRTYVLSPQVETRGGGVVTTSVAEQIDILRLLAEEKEPLIWRPWYGGSRTVHILRYNATEQRQETGSVGDTGIVTVAVQLQEV